MDRVDKRLMWMLVAGLAAVMAVAIAHFAVQPNRNVTLSYSAFLDRVESGAVVRVEMEGPVVSGQATDGSTFQSFAPDTNGLVDALREAEVDITARAGQPQTSMQQTLIGLIPVLLLLGMMAIFMLRSSKQARSTGGLGKSRAKRLDAQESAVRFADVAGAVEAKSSLGEIVDFLRRPERYAALGGRIPKGVLMMGPPGNGKTLLARAVAGEAGVPFYAVSGSDFVEMFVGIGASRVRDLFEAAKNTQPCIIFIDEIDAVGRHRSTSEGQSNDEREQTLNQLLVEMDGISGTPGIVVIAATNRPDVLDQALVRSGRFDREVIVDHPDRSARRQILEVHLRNVPLDQDIDLDGLAQATPGLSGADLANLVNEAVLLAVRSGASIIDSSLLERAKDKVMRGDERQGLLSSPNDRRRAAYRAAAASLVTLRSPDADLIAKASIIPRGRSFAHLTHFDAETGVLTKRQLHGRMAVLLSGRAAELLVYGPELISSATAESMAQATQLARSCILRWAMSDAWGPVVYDWQDDDADGTSWSNPPSLSDEDARALSQETRKLVDAALHTALSCLSAEQGKFEALAQAFEDRETLTGAEIATIVGARLLAVRQPA